MVNKRLLRWERLWNETNAQMGLSLKSFQKICEYVYDKGKEKDKIEKSK